jgi:hypothetical protein
MLESLVLTQFPRRATADDYKRAADELELLLTELPGALAVYRFGNVTAPGISDLDRLAVVERRGVVPDIWSRLSPRARYIAMHTPVVADPQAFTRHRWFAELGDLQLIWGEALPIEERPVSEYSELLIATEGLVVTALKLAKLAVTGRVKVRPLLCELRNVRLDLELARLARTDAGQAWALAEEVDSLRDGWWDLPNAEQRRRVQYLLARAPSAIREAIIAVETRVVPPERPRTLRLGAAWRNLTLVPGDPLDGRPATFLNLVGRSRWLGEARWQWVPRKLQLPPAVIALLAGDPPNQFEQFRSARDELVRRHVDFLAACPGYSALCLGATFVRR